MRKSRQESGGGWWALEDVDYEALGHGGICQICSGIETETMYLLKPTGERVCLKCRLSQKSIYAAVGSPLWLSLQKQRETVAKPVKVKPKMERVADMWAAVAERRRELKRDMDASEVFAIAGSFGLTAKDVQKTRNQPRMPMKPMGTVRLDKPIPLSDEEMIWASALSQVRDEEREAAEVAEEFDLSLEELEERLNQASGCASSTGGDLE